MTGKTTSSLARSSQERWEAEEAAGREECIFPATTVAARENERDWQSVCSRESDLRTSISVSDRQRDREREARETGVRRRQPDRSSSGGREAVKQGTTTASSLLMLLLLPSS